MALPPRWMGIGAAVLALGVSGLFGGLDEVDTGTELATVELGTVHTGEPWNVTVTGAGFADELESFEPRTPGNRWLVVAAVVEVTGEESRFDLYDVLRLRNASDLVSQGGAFPGRPDRILLKRDGAEAARLHPDMPEELYFFWEQAGRTEPPRELEIEIIGKTRRVDTLTGHMQWLDPEPRALVRAPVKDLTS